ncbi:hypothetical protein WA026_023070 [Henosepilachna vigintioctopunctata]|uniref:Uncharacterized protein n=1 Tax=Henosepilachna vigintioctopunctata TaxID=420089 RepID=A0AAW1V6L0_9CUCU
MSLKESLTNLIHRSSNNPFPVPFSFPAELHVVCLAHPNDMCLQRSKPLYQKLIDLSGYDGSISLPEELNEMGVTSLFHHCIETLKCGNLKSRIMLYSAPVHYIKVTDFDCQTYMVSETIDILGFISVNDIGYPMAVSRHLVLHGVQNIKDPLSMETEIDLTIDEDTNDESKTPSFRVLLHGALKVENMAALVSLGDNWFGFIYSWADTRKKSNLMLTLLVPGSDSVPWLGDQNYLGCTEQFEQFSSFPIRPSEKRILKTAWFGLALATIFEKECLSLPGNVHPDSAVQLHHAAEVLKKTQNQDAHFVITPYVANYNTL